MSRKLLQSMDQVCQVWVKMHVPGTTDVRLSPLPALQANICALEHACQQEHGSSLYSCSHYSISLAHMPMQDYPSSHLVLQ